MNTEQLIFDTLKGLVSNRCYPDTYPQAPATPVWPAIRFTKTGGNIDLDSCGSGLSDTDDETFQVDVVAATATSRTALREQIRTAMQALPCALSQSPIHTYDVETKTYRAILIYTFFGSSV